MGSHMWLTLGGLIWIYALIINYFNSIYILIKVTSPQIKLSNISEKPVAYSSFEFLTFNKNLFYYDEIW